MKKLIFICFVILFSCSGYVSSAKVSDQGVQLDGNLADCRLYVVRVNGVFGTDLYVIRCNSQLSSSWRTSCGKSCTQVHQSIVEEMNERVNGESMV